MYRSLCVTPRIHGTTVPLTHRRNAISDIRRCFTHSPLGRYQIPGENKKNREVQLADFLGGQRDNSACDRREPGKLWKRVICGVISEKRGNFEIAWRICQWVNRTESRDASSARIQGQRTLGHSLPETKKRSGVNSFPFGLSTGLSLARVARYFSNAR